MNYFRLKFHYYFISMLGKSRSTQKRINKYIKTLQIKDQERQNNHPIIGSLIRLPSHFRAIKWIDSSNIFTLPFYVINKRMLVRKSTSLNYSIVVLFYTYIFFQYNN